MSIVIKASVIFNHIWPVFIVINRQPNIFGVSSAHCTPTVVASVLPLMSLLCLLTAATCSMSVYMTTSDSALGITSGSSSDSMSFFAALTVMRGRLMRCGFESVGLNEKTEGTAVGFSLPLLTVLLHIHNIHW